jgi:hypothetical protein
VQIVEAVFYPPASPWIVLSVALKHLSLMQSFASLHKIRNLGPQGTKTTTSLSYVQKKYHQKGNFLIEYSSNMKFKKLFPNAGVLVIRWRFPQELVLMYKHYKLAGPRFSDDNPAGNDINQFRSYACQKPGSPRMLK